MNLGVLPAAHALYEWNIYIPAYGEVIQSLAFCPLGRHPQDACVTKGYDPGASCSRCTRPCISGSASMACARSSSRTAAMRARPTTRVASAGAEIVRHSTLAEGLVQLKDTLAATTGKALLSFYWAAIDAIAHIARAGHHLPRRRDRELLAHLRCSLLRRGQPRHALSLHGRPRPCLCRRPRHDLHQRAHPGAGRLPAR